MATLNDFKIIKQQSLKYFKYLNFDKDLREIDQARFGFYLFALECITNIKEIDSLKGLINDTEFCSVIYKERNDDLGIDAIHIDEENNKINLFNFKYRENYSAGKGQSTNDAIISTKFVNAFINNDLADLTPRTKRFVEKVIEKLNLDDVWELNLYLVSNESNGLSATDHSISTLREVYGLDVISYTLSDFSNFVSQKSSDQEAIFIVDRDSVLSYEEESLSSSKSYLFKLSVGELIRITSKDKEKKKQYNYEDEKIIKNLELDFSVLFDNVRGYLGKTKYNLNIFNTLKNDPTKFFMFNNGITMTAKDINVENINAKRKWKIDLTNFQVVNGGQTLRTLYEYKDAHSDFESLFSASVLVRVFKTGNEYGLTNKIAEYTNSQNAISPVDLKSLDTLQMQIEQMLKSENILYVRKVGDLGVDDQEYKFRISMERFGQLLYSIQGFPDRASNQKKRIFEGYYDQIFGEEVFDIEKSVDIVFKYKKIQEAYENSEFEMYDQKLFYAIYLYEQGVSIADCIELIEDTLKIYKAEQSLSDSRKLIQKGFKEELIKQLDK